MKYIYSVDIDASYSPSTSEGLSSMFDLYLQVEVLTRHFTKEYPNLNILELAVYSKSILIEFESKFMSRDELIELKNKIDDDLSDIYKNKFVNKGSISISERLDDKEVEELMSTMLDNPDSVDYNIMEITKEGVTVTVDTITGKVSPEVIS